MVRIDSEFQNLIPPLTADEYSALEQNILKDGCRDALVLWGDILVDGHNRYRICAKHNLVVVAIFPPPQANPAMNSAQWRVCPARHTNTLWLCLTMLPPLKTVQKDFTNRDDAMLWMMQNQLARRNLNDAQRIEIVRKCEGAIKAKAQERQETTRLTDCVVREIYNTERQEWRPPNYQITAKGMSDAYIGHWSDLHGFADCGEKGA